MYSKLSITVPEEILFDIKKIAQERQIKLSRLVSEALMEKIKKAKEESFVAQVNEVFEDPEVSAEYQRMTKDIADSVDVEELPW